MITLGQVKEELDKNYKPDHIHIGDDPLVPNRFLLYVNVLEYFGMDKSIPRKDMRLQLRNQYIECLGKIRDECAYRAFRCVSGKEDFLGLVVEVTKKCDKILEGKEECDTVPNVLPQRQDRE
jgi:hypothetical protein